MFTNSPRFSRPRSPTEKISKSEKSAKNAAKDLLYLDYLKMSENMDFNEMVQQKAIFVTGKDNQGRPVIAIYGDRIFTKEFFQDMERSLLYIIRTLHPIVQSEYIIVYIHSSFEAKNTPSFQFLKRAYEIFNRQYKKNLKQLYIVKPSKWLKFILYCFRPFISAKFWKKLMYVDDINGVYKYLDSIKLL